MPDLTSTEIRTRLERVDPSQLSGRCDQRFRQVYKLTQIPWKEVINFFAEEGYGWPDAAAQFGLKTQTLKAYSYRANVSFPWQGAASNQARLRHSLAKKGKPHAGGFPARKHTAFGHDGSLFDLVEWFAPPGVTYACVHSRVARGWSLEEALVAEKGQPRGRASPRAA